MADSANRSVSSYPSTNSSNLNAAPATGRKRSKGFARMTILDALVAAPILFGGGLRLLQVERAELQPVALQTPATPNAVWAATEHGLVALGPLDGSVYLDLQDADDIRALALDYPRGTMWACSRDTLTAYGPAGAPQASVSLPKPTGGDARPMAVAPDGSVWVGVKKALYHVTPQGAIEATIAFPEDIRAVATDRTRSLAWIGTATSLTALDAVSGNVSLALGLGQSATCAPSRSRRSPARCGSAWTPGLSVSARRDSSC